MLSSTLKFITNIMNYVHDILVISSKSMGLMLNDKQLHFLVIGVIGIILFLVVHKLFKYLVQYSLRAISFIYTVTVLIVFVFAIEMA